MNAWTADQAWYDGRKAGHSALWLFVEGFIKSNDIKSMLEVGGGYGYASELVKRYCGIEINPAAIAAGRARFPHATFIEGDFCSLKATGRAGHFDMVLACAVVEHCESYRTLIIKALDAHSRFVVVSFFRGLDRPQDEIRRMDSEDTEWSKAGGVYWDNAYARQPLTDWLRGLSVDWHLKHLGRDMVLIMRGRQP